jgi:hypothetical protein
MIPAATITLGTSPSQYFRVIACALNASTRET